MSTKSSSNTRRAQRIRRRLRRTSYGRPRLSVFRSSKHIYAQVIDDTKGETLASASTREPDIRGGKKTGANVDAAKAVGLRIAERASAAGVKEGPVRSRAISLSRGASRRSPTPPAEGGLKF